MRKWTVLYYEVLQYQEENLRLLHEKFKVLTLPDPTYDTPFILTQADVILMPLGFFFGKEKIDQASKLKIIASNTTGHPHIDVAYARDKGLKVVTLKNQKAFLKKITPTAELTWGLIIALTRNIIPAHRSVLEGKWDRRPFGGPSMLSRMSLGVAGYGRLGSLVASYGKSFGMTVRYYDPFVSKKNTGIRRVASLKELVRLSNIVTVHIPHERETENLFNRETFACFRKGSYLINTSRGELVDHQALLDCLIDGRLAGAALDVFEGEFHPGFQGQFGSHPLVEYAQKHSNLIITPHIGGSTIDAWKMTEEYTIKKVVHEFHKNLFKRRNPSEI
jgi:D-3-phosphoglycerate dehydrogenase